MCPGDLFTLTQRIMEVSELAALQVIRLQNPAFDEVTKSEAYKIAGSRRWFDYHCKVGHIKPIRRGSAQNSPIFYSRVQIAALKRAEAELKFNDERYRKDGYPLPGLHD